MIITNRELFFNGYRSQFGALKQEQLDGLNAILDAFAKDPELKDVRQAAYMLATTWRETGQTYQPITEYGKENYFRKYDGRYGNNKPGDGYRYRGRGYVQLTFKNNYKKASEKLSSLTDRYPQGINLVNNPDDTLKLQVAADIMIMGMREGWFTTRKLSDYIGEKKCDYYNARQIINARDHASEIADVAKKFESLLTSAIMENIENQPSVVTPKNALY